MRAFFLIDIEASSWNSVPPFKCLTAPRVWSLFRTLKLALCCGPHSSGWRKSTGAASGPDVDASSRVSGEWTVWTSLVFSVSVDIHTKCDSPQASCLGRVWGGAVLTHADDDCNSARKRNRWVGKACLSCEGQSIPVSLTNELYFRPLHAGVLLCCL